jgi:hypothetical protein
MCQFPPITYQIFCPYTPGQNGVAERKHLHIVELGLAMLYEASMPVEAFSTAIFLINILPSTKLNMCSSYQLKIKPKLSVYVWMSVLPLSSGIHFEFDPRSLPCVFLGYSDKHKGMVSLILFGWSRVGSKTPNRRGIFLSFIFVFTYMLLVAKNLSWIGNLPTW